MMNFSKLSLLALMMAFTAPAFATVDRASITCPCKCKQNWLYKFITVTPADVGLTEEHNDSDLFYRAPQACSAFCKSTTGDGSSYVRACW